ncbi:hypothetical protein [Serratia marcescens]|uniref:Uncharacterized protein n=1 Tax=Serratia marcescens TaxID=615 RepID=A0A380A261_SERMA|nr:hypothetical protein [Serratia marcescens]KFD11640.1 hypothetical protein GSMA_03861 [Serratia marcescens subsp. marcescens ATCC 13880]KFL03286.1 hypothetical protein DP21_3552 [Serratia marcescens]MCC3249444.1 hypothetical protein [Serratia marcescens]PNU46137.1 hypothetical protein C2M02_02615 [Serratia marcescens subsp. marcescens ATCC 13880]QDL85522.1 hypothetical protein FG183_09435 [Serratia marcescens subsp. marcescens ATCC 13880]
MGNLNNRSLWTENIYQIEDSDLVKGGESGVGNIQASQLAARTTYLKNLFETLMSMVSLGESPYSSVEKAQAAIDSGKIPLDAVFSVLSADNEKAVELYKNENGIATPTGDSYASLAFVEVLSSALDFLNARIPRQLGANLAGYQFMITDSTGIKGLFGIDDDGGLVATGLDEPMQDYLRNMVSTSFSNRIAGYQVVIFAQDMKNALFAIDDDGGAWLPGMDEPVQNYLTPIQPAGFSSRIEGYQFVLFAKALSDAILAIDNDGGLWLPGMNEPVQDALSASGPGLVRPHNGIPALFADKTAETPVWDRAPVVSATPITRDGVSFIFQENAVLRAGLFPLRYPVNQGYPIRELPLKPAEIHALYGRGQSLRVGQDARLSDFDPEYAGHLLMFSGAGQDRGCQWPPDGPVTDTTLGGFTDAQPLPYRQNCQVPGALHVLRRHKKRGIAVDDMPILLTRMDAKSGTGYEGLKKGTLPYLDGLTSCQAFTNRAIAVGKIPIVKCVGYTFGEHDSALVSEFGQFRAMQDEWINDTQADLMKITGQASRILIDLDQIGSVMVVPRPGQSTLRGDIIAIDQWELSLARLDVFMSTPKYHLNRQFASDFQHLNGLGYCILGEYQGQAEDFTLYDRLTNPQGRKWRPVEPESIVAINENTFDVTLNSPLGGALRINTDIGTAPNLGIDLSLKSTEVNSVQQNSDRVFRIVTNGPPAAGDYFRFGFNAIDNKDFNGINWTHPLVNISDESNILSDYKKGFKLTNWCVLSRIAVPAERG